LNKKVPKQNKARLMKNATHHLADFLLKYLSQILISFLFVGLILFINNIWFSEGEYALPTRSVSWIGVVFSVFSLAACDGFLGRSNSEKVTKATQWLSGIMLVLYIAVPTIARSHVHNKGRYWMVASVFSDEWELQKPTFSILGREYQYHSYPRWSFLQKVKDPFNLPEKTDPYQEGFVWESSLVTTTSAVEGFVLVITTHYRATADEKEHNILALRDESFTVKMIEDRISKEFIPSLVSRIVEVSEQCKLDLETEVVTGFKPASPLRSDIEFTSETFSCSYKLKPKVL
jgi:hypothetical protein